MMICLKTQAKQASEQRIAVLLHDRLPSKVSSPVELMCVFKVEAGSDHYLFCYVVSGCVEMTCQRCLGAFQYDYTNHTSLAVCSREDRAEALMAYMDCIVAHDNQISLVDILTDELHLFLPEKHENENECDVEIKAFIEDKC